MSYVTEIARAADGWCDYAIRRPDGSVLCTGRRRATLAETRAHLRQVVARLVLAPALGSGTAWSRAVAKAGAARRASLNGD
jgi:hypothetical protein